MMYERESGGSRVSVRFVGLFTGLVRLQDSHSPGPRGMLRGRFTWGGLVGLVYWGLTPQQQPGSYQLIKAVK